ncbi:MAG: class I adenylate-forming enzyme family protein [Bacteroidales bacterium]
MKSIEEQIYQIALKTPNKTAVISGDLFVSYKELWKRINQSAIYFTKVLNLERGSRIVLSAGKSIDFVYHYMGAHLAGMICVPIDPETNHLRFERILSSASPNYCIGNIKCYQEASPFPSLEQIEVPESNQFSFPDIHDVADILYTTGTTGQPKGVTLSYRSLSAAANNINSFIGNTYNDIELLALPISHSFGLGRLRCVLSGGGTLVLLGSFASMKKFYGEMERCKVTGFGMVPASWAYLKKMSGKKIGEFAEQINYIEIGSAFMPHEEKKFLMELFPHTRICMHYGLTEASRSAFMEFHSDREYLNSIGRPSPNVDIRIFSEDGFVLEEGEEGELCVKGDHVCHSYWNVSEDEFQRDFHGAYFKTGDWGYIKNNYIYLKSRKKEIINVGGKKVSPVEVEEVLNQIEGIEESVCIGVQDPANVLGEIVKAFVVITNEALQDKEIFAYVQARLENYKVPVLIERIKEIPKTSSGKIQRLLLK